MNKQQAAKYLGVSTRAVERYAEKGKLTVRKQKGKRGDEAVYDEKELRKLKAEIDSSRSIVRPSVSTPDTPEQTTIALPDVSALAAPELMQALIVAAAAHLERGGLSISQGERVLLTIDQAREHTGFSYRTIRDAIHTGDLYAKKIKGRWRIRPRDLRAYIDALMQPA